MKICMDAKVADRTYGNEMSEKIQYRIGRCHPGPMSRFGFISMGSGSKNYGSKYRN